MRGARVQARLEVCPRCDAAIILALDDPVAGLPVRADPLPLDAAQELEARLEGRLTYNLHIQNWSGRRTLTERLPEHMSRRETPVIAAHRCPGPIPATAIPQPPPEPDGREPDLFTPQPDDDIPDGFPF